MSDADYILQIAESSQKLERSNTQSLLRTQSKEGDMVRQTAVVETKLKWELFLWVVCLWES